MILPLIRKPITITLVISIAFYTLSLLITIFDNGFENRWISFFFWICAISYFPLIIIAGYLRNKHSSEIKFPRKDMIFLIGVVIISLALNFTLLKEYPFVSIYDQVRDGGLNAVQVYDGTIRNIFSYGRYDSHGLIIPTIISFLFPLFGNSVLLFRFPAALLTFLSAIIIFMIMRKEFDSLTGFFSSVVFLTIPLTLYYGRTEVVVTFSTFLFSLIVLFLYKFLSTRKEELYLLGGTLLGFSSGFHTSIRTMAVLTLCLITTITVFDFFKTKNIKKPFFLLILLAVFYIIGFGPRILYTSPEIFFQTRSFALNQTEESEQFKFSEIISNYSKSLMVYVSEPTLSTHYPDFKPVLPITSALFFIIGLMFVLNSKNNFMKLITFYALIIPLTNSAITDTINSDNRFGPLFIVASLITGFGISQLLSLSKNKRTKLVTTLIITLLLIWSTSSFFTNALAAKNYSHIDYLSMHSIYFIKNDPQLMNATHLCIISNPAFYEYSKLFHVQEQFQFFLPKKSLYIIENDLLGTEEISISTSCGDFDKANFKKYEFCKTKDIFICPQGSLIINKELGDKSFSAPKDRYFYIGPTPVFIP